MRKIRTFLDSGVLIAAARGTSAHALKAISIIDDPNRIFLSSYFVQLEIVPKAMYYQLTDQVKFYEEYFKNVEWADHTKLYQRAFNEAATAGVNAMDALHLVAAKSLKADEFITTEKPTHTIHFSKLVKIISIY